jgi:ubiquinone/menaquinone biosynthesis C-methylase UbiE
LKAHLFGTKIEERRWARRHFQHGKDGIKDCKEVRNHPHRQFLMEKIEAFSPISSILEIGCSYGPNLYLIAKKFPNAKIEGIDINPRAVQIGNELFIKEGISNVKLLVGKADELDQFQDKSFDIVFTDAVLLYIAPDKIRKVIREMIRVTRQALILVEWHCEHQDKDPFSLGVYHFGHWKRNYLNLLKQFVPKEKIRVIKIPEQLWPNEGWREFGYIIEVII